MSITLSALQQQRRDTAANWTSANPTLLAGEIGVETDTGLLKIGDGSTAWTSLDYLPLSFEGYAANGIYNPAANQVALATNGTGRLFIDSSGSVGIGTSSPGRTLDVNGVIRSDGTSGALAFGGNSSTPSEGAAIHRPANSTLAFCTDSTEQMRIDSSGNVGIGTVNPGANLYVKQSGTDFTAASQTVAVFQRSSTTGHSAKIAIVAGNAATSDIHFGDTDDEDVGILQYNHSNEAFNFNQNVGIGTSSPAGGLHVDAASGVDGPVFDSGGTANTNHALLVRDSGNNQLLRVNNNGNVGIGTSSPAYKLHVAGSINAYNGFLRIAGTSSPSGNDPHIYRPGTSEMGFWAGGSDRMRIDSSGNVGVGTSLPSDVLHVVGDGGDSDNSATSLAQSASKAKIRFQSRTGSSLSEFQGTVNSGDTWYSQIANESGTSSYNQVFNPFGGAVGIGTTNPGFALQVRKNSANTSPLSHNYPASESGILADNATSTTGTFSALSLRSFNDNGYAAVASIICESTATNYKPNILFTQRSGSGTNAELMRIDSSGRLLVGTSSARDDFFNSASTYSPILQVETSGSQDRFISLVYNDASENQSHIILGKTRGTSGGSHAVVQSGDGLGAISYMGADGSELVEAARIAAQVDGTPGADDMPGRLVFSTTADGESSPTERMRISNNGFVDIPGVYDFTTASAANVNVDSTGGIRRSTSSSKYKTSIETLEDSYADALLSCRPVWYRSTCEGDNPAHGWWGFIAEEVAAIDPRLIHWKTVEVTYNENGSAVKTPCDPEPEGVAYDRFVPHLLNLIKRQKEQIEAMETRLSALEAP